MYGGQRLNTLWHIHTVEYYAASEKVWEILHILAHTGMNSGYRADYFSKIKIHSPVSISLKLQREKSRRLYPKPLTGLSLKSGLECLSSFSYISELF